MQNNPTVEEREQQESETLTERVKDRSDMTK